MLPTLPDGTEVVVDFSPVIVQRGDLLLFRQSDYLVIHRLVGSATFPDGRPCWRTRGDGLAAFDPPLEPSGVVGRVTAISREGSWWDLEGAGGRLYAIAAALHGFFWSALGVAVEKTLDRLLARLGSARSVRWRVNAADRRLLALADRCLFRRLHARRTEPRF